MERDALRARVQTCAVGLGPDREAHFAAGRGAHAIWPRIAGSVYRWKWERYSHWLTGSGRPRRLCNHEPRWLSEAIVTLGLQDGAVPPDTSADNGTEAMTGGPGSGGRCRGAGC